MIGGFVGRTRELGVLEAARTVARNGESCVVVVAGEAGIGKTRLCRDRDGAVAAFGRAVDATRLLGNRPMTAVNTADLALALVARDGPGDRARAAELLAAAHGEAVAMGLDRRAAHWNEALAGLTETAATIVRTGRQWVLTVGGRRAVVADRVGVRYLARLLTSPGRP